MLLFGAALGRWPWLALAPAALVWPALLLATGTMDLEPGLTGAAALSVINAAAGVAVHQAALWAMRRVRTVSPRRDAR
jgi:hypothetical protein